MSAGTANPTTWPRCRGPLAYGHAGATRIFREPEVRAGWDMRTDDTSRSTLVPTTPPDHGMDGSGHGNSECDKHEHRREPRVRARRRRVSGDGGSRRTDR